MNSKKIIANLTALATIASMSASFSSFSAFADNSSETSKGAYVLMNIPYDDFYKSEITNDVRVDGVTSATLQKTRMETMVKGSFHEDPNGTDIAGVTYPVKVSDISLLSGYKQVSDSDSVTITTSNKGNTAETTYTGKDSLFENEKYSYYVLSENETPDNYKELSFDKDGNPSFSEIKGNEAKSIASEAAITSSSKYGDYQINIEDVPFSSDTIYGVILKTEDGKSYGLRHLENVWKVKKLAWCTGTTTQVKGCPTDSEHYKSMLGHTITGIEYITSSGVYNIGTSLEVPEYKYVLMNIPYADFYKSEITNDVDVDGVTSATLQKTRTGTLVAGSFHEDCNGTDITGITYPVKVDINKLSSYKQVKDTDSVTITTTNRGNTAETVYSGKDSLFENEKYAYYVLSNSEIPANYKEVSFDENGKPSFSEIKGQKSQEVTDAEATITTDSKYGDYQISIANLPFSDATVYAVVLKTEDGKSYGLRHLENVWRVSQLAWCTGNTTSVHGSPTSSDHYISMVGHTITDIEYVTSTGVYNIKTNLEVSEVKVDTEKLEAAIKTAEQLKEIDYTSESWSTLKFAVENAKNTLSTAKKQSEADKSVEDLTAVINALVPTISDVTGLKVSSTTANSVKLTWNKVTTANGYTVYKYDTTKKTWVNVANTTTNTYTVSKLSSAASYKFAVKAYKTVNDKLVSSEKYPTVTAVTNPAVVSGLKASSTSASAVKLTWNKVSGANGYVVYKYDTSKKTWVRTAKITANTYTASKLKAGTSYKFAVKAYKTVNGKELLSTSFPQITTSTVPATVNFKLTAGSKKATVKWSKVTGASGYTVYYKTSKNGKWVKLKSITSTSYTKTGLTKGKTYYFTVKAYRTVNGKTYNGSFTTKSVKVK